MVDARVLADMKVTMKIVKYEGSRKSHVSFPTHELSPE